MLLILIFFSALCLIFTLNAGLASAYVGPGLGLGTIGTVLGVLISIVLAIIALVWYPIKKLFKKRKVNQEKD